MRCVHAGFLYVSDSGIPQELIDAGFEANKRYFQLPAEEKAKLPEVDWASQSYTGHNPGNKSSGMPTPACVMACMQMPVHSYVPRLARDGCARGPLEVVVGSAGC
jgi:isopenicillin N synthase-like dioxygenase